MPVDIACDFMGNWDTYGGNSFVASSEDRETSLSTSKRASVSEFSCRSSWEYWSRPSTPFFKCASKFATSPAMTSCRLRAPRASFSQRSAAETTSANMAFVRFNFDCVCCTSASRLGRPSNKTLRRNSLCRRASARAVSLGKCAAGETTDTTGGSTTRVCIFIGFVDSCTSNDVIV